MYSTGFPGGSVVKKKISPPMNETRVQSLIPEVALEKEMASHSSVLAWEIPWTEEPGGLQSVGMKESQIPKQQQVYSTRNSTQSLQ